ncbi:putative EamA domain-containing protein [Lupinus albus]|uniref:WAT1-related protein n=1 Tax=Lupinus albus TaxID=3870 RepID=A0A6A4PPT4_LUPAL|nr:putative EamA domain-containing protein [Lupinus albus]
MCCRGNCDYTVQGSNYIQPSCTITQQQHFTTNSIWVSVRGKELDTWLHVPYRSLFVLQAPLLKNYPARLSVTSYTCFFGLLQFLLIALVLERNATAWVFQSGGELFTILYAGVVASGIAFAVQIWCIDRGGPVFVAVYQPIQTLVVAIMASFALGEEFYLGGFVLPNDVIGSLEQY